MQRLTGLDATFLYMETPSSPMHVSSLFILDPSTATVDFTFENLRSLIDPKRRAGQGSGRTARPRHSTGRWALLYTDQAADRNRDVTS